MPESWLGIDVGGANLKLADGRGFAHSEHFPLWREPQNLAAKLRECIDRAPPCRGIAATMTGELADCFATKREGVAAIVAALPSAAGDLPLRIYLTNGAWATPQDATQRFLEAAAANWHALARFAARYLPAASGLLIDIGSTTCDIIPIEKGVPVACGRTDPDRLASGELVYTGVVRSPVCGITSELPWRGWMCATAQELFATALDAYLLLGEIAEDPHDCHTADGRPATRERARDRLARMICADRDMFSEADALSAAQAIADAQVRQIAAALRKVIDEQGGATEQCGTSLREVIQAAHRGRSPRTEVHLAERRATRFRDCALISGQGEFLAKRVLERVAFNGEVASLRERLGPALSQVATAHALAVLAREDSIGKATQGESVATARIEAGPARTSLRVVKLGGSLLDQPELANLLHSWLSRQPGAINVLIAGGGSLTDCIRAADALHHLGEETSHWLCIRLLSVTARMLAALLPEAELVEDLAAIVRVRRSRLLVLDPLPFLRDRERRATDSPLPHRWDVTSDSIAALVAHELTADELVLLKSALPPEDASLQEMAECGFVDSYFPTAASGMMNIRLVNLRDQTSAEPTVH